MPTDEEKLDFLYKREFNKISTSVLKEYYNEPYNSAKIVNPTSIWTNYNTIPQVPPVLTDGQINGVVQYFEKKQLTELSPNSFYHADLKNAIPPACGDGYMYKIYNVIDQEIYFGQGDWFIDNGAGLLRFYGTVPPGAPFKVSFYRYVGETGGGGGTDASVTITQVGHSFTLGQCVYLDGTWKLASSALESTFAGAIVSQVNGDNFSLITSGPLTLTGHGLTGILYLGTGGQIVDSIPADYIYPVGYVIDLNRIFVSFTYARTRMTLIDPKISQAAPQITLGFDISSLTAARTLILPDLDTDLTYASQMDQTVSTSASPSFAALKLADIVNNITISAPTLAASYSLVLPDSDGAPNQVLSTNGSGQLTWVSVSGATTEFASDTFSIYESGAPTAKITFNTNALTTARSIIMPDEDVDLGQITNIDQDLSTTSSPEFASLNLPGGSFSVNLSAPTLLANYSLVLPSDDGINGQVLTTNGFGILSWSTNSASSEFPTNTFSIYDSVTPTQKIKFDASNVTGEKTIIMPNANTDLTFAAQMDQNVSSISSPVFVMAKLTSELQLEDPNAGSNYISLKSPVLTSDYSIILPNVQGAANAILVNNGSGLLSWVDKNNVEDSLFTINNTVDPTKKAQFQLSTLNGGQEINIILPPRDVNLNWASQMDQNVAISSTPTFSSSIFKTSLQLEDPGLGTELITIKAPASLPLSYVLTLPANDGAIGQFLSTDGSGILSWESCVQETVFSTDDFALYDDAEPNRRLQFDLTGISIGATRHIIMPNSDVNLSLASQMNQDVSIDSNVQFAELLVITNVRLQDPGGSNKITLQAPSPLALGYTLTFPPNDGDAGQLLTTDGTGILTWESQNTSFIDEQFEIVDNIYGSSIKFQLGAMTSGLQRIITIPDSNIDLTLASQLNQSVAVGASPSFADPVITNSLSLEDPGASVNKIVLQSPSLSLNYALTLPTSAGQMGQYLMTDGSGILSWASSTSGTVFADNVFAITNAAMPTKRIQFNAANILENNTSTIIVPDEDVDLQWVASMDQTVASTSSPNFVELLLGSGVNKITLESAVLSAPYTLTFPDGAGAPDQVLKTDGTGTLGWLSLPIEFASDEFAIYDSVEPTTKLFFDISTITSGQQRTIIIPDEDIDLQWVALMNQTVATTASPQFAALNLSNGSYNITLQAPTLSSSYLLSLPPTAPNVGQIIKATSSSAMSWANPQFDVANFSLTDGASSLTFALTAGDHTISIPDADVDLQYAPNQNVSAGSSPSFATPHVTGSLQLEDPTPGTEMIAFRAPNALATSYSIILPTTTGTVDQLLKTDGSGQLQWHTLSDEFDSATFRVINGTKKIEFDLSALTNNNTRIITIPNVNVDLTWASQMNQSVAIEASPIFVSAEVTLLKLQDPGVGTFAISFQAPTLTSSYSLTFPSNDGNLNQMLTTNGSGILSWTDTPTTFDVATFGIYSGTKQLAFNITAIDSGVHTIIMPNSDVDLFWASEMDQNVSQTSDVIFNTVENILLKIQDPGVGINTISLQAPTLAGSYVLTLPTTNGTSGQVLRTDGAGILSWVDILDSSEFSDAAFAIYDNVDSSKKIKFQASGLDPSTECTIIVPNIASVNLSYAAQMDQSVASTSNVTFETAHLMTGLELEDQGASSYYISLHAPTLTANYTLTLPSSAGLNDQVMVSNGSGILSWAQRGVFEDATFAILEGTKRLEFELAAISGGTTRTIYIPDSDINLSYASQMNQTVASSASPTFISAKLTQLQLEDPGVGSEVITLRAPPTLLVGYTLTLPHNDGEVNQVLISDGAGTLSWKDKDIVKDGEFKIVNSGDLTKEILFDASGITAGQTYTITMPDYDVNLQWAGLMNQSVTSTSSVQFTAIKTTTTLQLEDPGAGTELVTISAPTALATGYSLILPTTDGTPGQVLQTDGSGNLGWISSVGNTEFEDSTFAIFDDGDPTKKIKFQAFNIASDQSRTIIMPDSDVNLVWVANLDQQLTTSSGVIFDTLKCKTSLSLENPDTGTTTITLQAPSSLTSNYTLTFPINNGDSDQVLQTDGSGNLSWISRSTFADDVFTIVDNVYPNKKIQFQASSITDGFTRQIIMPDANVDLAWLVQMDQAVGTTDNVEFATLRATTSIQIEDPSAGQFSVTMQAPTGLGSNYTLTLPDDTGTLNQVLATNGSGVLSWIDLSESDVFTTDTFAIVDATINTKRIRFNAAAIASSTDRTIIMPNSDVDLSYVANMDQSLATTDSPAFEIITANTSIILTDPGAGSNTITLRAPTLGVNYTLTLPVDDGLNGQRLMTNGSGVLSWANAVSVTEFSDAEFAIYNSLTTSKKLLFNCGNLGAGVECTLYIPNVASINLEYAAQMNQDVGNTALPTFASVTSPIFKIKDGSYNITLLSPTLAANYSLTFPNTDGETNQVLVTDGAGVLTWENKNVFVDNDFKIVDDGSITRALQFQLSGITSGQTRIITMPDYNVNLQWAGLMDQNVGAGSIPSFSSPKITTELQIEDPGVGINIVALRAPSALAASYTLTLPVDDGEADQVLATNGSGILSWANKGSFTDATFTIDNIAEPSKQIAFNAATITAGNVRTIYMPDSDVYLVWAAGMDQAVSTTSSPNFASPKCTTSLLIEDPGGSTNSVTLQAPTLSASYSLTLPTDNGTPDQMLITNGSGILSWQSRATFVDSTFVVSNSLDSTKKVDFDLSNIVTGNQWSIIMPSRDVNLSWASLMDQSVAQTADAMFQSVKVTSSLQIEDPGISSYKINLVAPALISDYSLTLPPIQSTGDQILVAGVTGLLNWVQRGQFTDDIFVVKNINNLSKSATFDLNALNPSTNCTISLPPRDVDLGWASLMDQNIATTSNVEFALVTVPQIQLENGSYNITLQAPVLSASYSLTLPIDDGASGQILTTNGSGILSWITEGDFHTSTFKLRDDISSYYVDFDLSAFSTNHTITLPNANVDLTWAAAMNQSVATTAITEFASVQTVSLLLEDPGAGDEVIHIKAPNTLVTGYTLTFPLVADAADQILVANGSGQLNWTQRGIFYDNVFTLKDEGDPTKQTKFQLSGLGAGQTATITVPGDVNLIWAASMNQYVSTSSSPTFTTVHCASSLELEDPGSGTYKLTLRAPTSLTDNFVFTLPENDGNSGQYLITDGAGFLSWQDPAVYDTNIFAIVDVVYPSKRIKFDATAISIGEDRYIIMPDYNVDLQYAGIMNQSVATTANTVFNEIQSKKLLLEDPGIGTYTISLQAPTLGDAYTLTFPTTIGGLDQVLTTQGAGALAWKQRGRFTTSVFDLYNAGETNKITFNLSSISANRIISIPDANIDLIWAASMDQYVATTDDVTFNSVLTSSLQLEDPDSGTNKIIIEAPTTLVTNYSLVFPDSGGGSDQILTATAGVFSWAQRGWFKDSVFTLQKTTDITAKVIFNMDALSTATTRTITLPDSNFSLAFASQMDQTVATTADVTFNSAIIGTTFAFKETPASVYAIEFESPTLAATYTLTWPIDAGLADQMLVTDGTGNLSWKDRAAFADSIFTIINTVDDSKKIAFDASNISPNETRTITMPDYNVSLQYAGLMDQTVATTADPTFNTVKTTTAVQLADGANTVSLRAPTLTGSYTITFPADDGDANNVLITDGAGLLNWITAIDLIPEKYTTGFASWSDSGDYYSIALPNFVVERGGSGYIKSQSVSWSGSQSIYLADFTSYIIYIDENGNIGAQSSYSSSVYENYVALFNVYRDGANIIVRKDVRPFQSNTTITGFLRQSLNTVVIGTGAKMERVTTGTGLVATDRQIKLIGEDSLEDIGISTIIPDSGGIGIDLQVWYTNTISQWQRSSNQKQITMLYNNSGTPASLTSGSFGIFRIYATHSDLNTAYPTYFALMHDVEYASSAEAQSAIDDGNVVGPSGELILLGICQLGYLIVENNANGGYIQAVVVSRNTFVSSAGSAGSSTSHLLLAGLTGGQYADGGHALLLQRHEASVDPTATDDTDNYRIGAQWIRTDNDTVWSCVDNTDNSAIWKQYAFNLDSVTFTTAKCTTSLQLEDPGIGLYTVSLRAPTLTSSYTITLPPDDGGADQLLVSNGAGTLSWKQRGVFTTDVFTVQDEIDQAKEVIFDLSSLSSGIQRTIIMPNTNVNLTYASQMNQTVASTASPTFASTIFSTSLLLKDPGISGNSITFQAPTLVSSYTLTFPINDGTPGQFLKTDGNGGLSWIDSSAFTDDLFKILNTVDDSKIIAFDASGIDSDTTRTITMPNYNVDLGWAGLMDQSVATTASVQFTTLKATTALQLEDPSAGTNTVSLTAPNSLSASYSLTFPPNDGNQHDLLTTDGSGVLDWHPIYDIMPDIILTGVQSWTGAGDYFTVTLPNFTINRAGYGYIHAEPVSWIGGQSITLATNNSYLVYINSNGILNYTATPTENTYKDNITLFTVIYDGTVTLVKREWRQYYNPSGILECIRNLFNCIIEDGGGKCERITIGDGSLTTDRQLKYVGSDIVNDQEIRSTLTDSGGGAVSFKFWYIQSGGKWKQYAEQGEFPLQYNNAGTPTTISVGQWCVFRIYVMVDDGNSIYPRRIAIMHNNVYSTLEALVSGIREDQISTTTNELALLSMAQLGYVIMTNTLQGGKIHSILSHKHTLGRTSAAIASHLLNDDLTGGQYSDGGHIKLAQTHSATADPTSTDDTLNYRVGTQWIREDLNTAWTCVDNASSAAIWRKYAFIDIDAQFPTLKATTSLQIEDPGVGTNAVSLIAPTSLGASYTLTLPLDDGDADQLLVSDGSGVLNWVQRGRFKTNVFTILDVSLTRELHFNIDGITGGQTRTLTMPDYNVDLGWAGLMDQSVATTSSVQFTTLKTTTSLQLEDPGATTYIVTLQAPALTSSHTLTLPTTAGGADQLLISDGSGVLSWMQRGSFTDTVFIVKDQNDANKSIQFELSGLSAPRVITFPDANFNLLYASQMNQTVANTASPTFASMHLTTSLVLEDPSAGTNIITLQAPTSLADSYTLILPTTDGEPDQLLTTNGSGALSWSDKGTFNDSTFTIASVLDSNNKITFNATSVVGIKTISMPNANIDLTYLAGLNQYVSSSSSPSFASPKCTTSLVLEDPGAGSNYISLKAPTLTADYTLTFPTTAPLADYILATIDTSGNCGWMQRGIYKSDIFTLQDVTDQSRILKFNISNLPVGTSYITLPSSSVDLTYAAQMNQNVSSNSNPAFSSLKCTTALVIEDPGAGTEIISIRAPVALPLAYTLTLPTDDGTIGQILVTDGSGVLSWIDKSSFAAAAFSISNTEDPAGKLKFDLDAISSGITRTITMPDSNVSLSWVASMNQSVATTSSPTFVTPTVTTSLRFEDPAVGTNVATLQAPADLSVNYTLTLPTTAGNADQLLVSNGSGILSWVQRGKYLTSVFELQDTTEPSRKLHFDLSGIQIGTIKTITMPDANVDLTWASQMNQTVASTATPSFVSVRCTTSLLLEDTGVSTNTIEIQAPTPLTSSYTLIMPANDGDSGQVLSTNGSGILNWVNPAQFTDATFTVVDDSNPANGITFDVGSVTGVKTITFPDANFSLLYASQMNQTVATTATVEFATLKTTTALQLEDPGVGSFIATIQAPTLATNYTLTLPTTDGDADQLLVSDGNGNLSWKNRASITDIDFAIVDVADSTKKIKFSTSLLATGEVSTIVSPVGTVNLTYAAAMNQSVATGASPTFIAPLCKTAIHIEDSGVGTNYVALGAPSALATSYSITLPPTAGSADQLLVSDGVGVLSWKQRGIFTDSIFKIVDTATQTRTLQFDVDAIDTGTIKTITIPNANVDLTYVAGQNQYLSSTSSPTFALQTLTSGLRLEDPGAGSNYIALSAPTLTTNYTLTFPTTDGDADQLLVSNGSGVLSWVQRGIYSDLTLTVTNAVGGQMRFNVAGVASGQTRTIIMPNRDVDLNYPSLMDQSVATTSSVQFATLKATTAVQLEDPGANLFTVSLQAPTLTASYTLTLPTTDGDSNQFLVSDGTGILSWKTYGSFADTEFTLYDDAAPTKLARFNLNAITPGETRIITMPDANVNLAYAAGMDQTVATTSSPIFVSPKCIASLIIEDPGGGTNTITIQAPTLTGNYSLTLPITDGDVDQLLVSDGAGILSWKQRGTFTDGVFKITDSATQTKTILFNATNLSAGIPRTITMPDADVSLLYASQMNQTVASTASPTFASALFTTSVKIEDPGVGTNYVTLQSPTLTTSYSLTLPPSAGSTDQFLVSDGTGVLSWIQRGIYSDSVFSIYDAAAPTNYAKFEVAGLTAIRTITVPNYDVNLSYAGLMDQTVATTASPTFVSPKCTQSIELEDPDTGTNTVAFEAPSPLAASYTLTMPVTAGANGQLLSTNGSGALSWITVGGVTPVFQDDEFTIQNSVDNTKQIQFDASSIATGTTRTVSVPNSDVDLVWNTRNGIAIVTTTAYSITATDRIVHVIGSGLRTVTLTTAETIAGRQIIIKDGAGNSKTNTITIDTQVGQTIDGDATYVMGSTAYDSVLLYSDGSNWFVGSKY